MTLFSSTRFVCRVDPPRPRLSVDDWVAAGGQAEFGTPLFDVRGGRIECRISYRDAGNHVSARGSADNSGDAFLRAIEQIEKTIGTGWRPAT